MSEAEALTRAYSLIETKALDVERRTFRGWATTPECDRMLDTIDPKGATFRNPLALLHGHRHDAPIGTASLHAPTARGIRFEAQIPKITEPGLLKDRTDLAWAEVASGLVRAVSIGFRPLPSSTERNAHGGLHFKAIEIIELSTVSCPANASATIDQIKAFDAEARAAAGRVAVPAPPLILASSGDDEDLALYRDACALVRELRETFERGYDKPDRVVRYTQYVHTLNEQRAIAAEVRLQIVNKALSDRITALEAANAALRKQMGEPR
jgi:hypothetical protein